MDNLGELAITLSRIAHDGVRDEPMRHDIGLLLIAPVRQYIAGLTQRIAELEARDKNWDAVIQEELACTTFALFEALGADYTKIYVEGRPIQEVMLLAIAELKAKTQG